MKKMLLSLVVLSACFGAFANIVTDDMLNIYKQSVINHPNKTKFTAFVTCAQNDNIKDFTTLCAEMKKLTGDAYDSAWCVEFVYNSGKDTLASFVKEAYVTAKSNKDTYIYLYGRRFFSELGLTMSEHLLSCMTITSSTFFTVKYIGEFVNQLADNCYILEDEVVVKYLNKLNRILTPKVLDNTAYESIVAKVRTLLETYK